MKNLHDKILREGIELIFENAKELLLDAELLFENGRYARAYALCQFCIEEMGKSRLIFEQIIFAGDTQMELNDKEFWKKFRNHRTKTEKSTMIDFSIEHNLSKSKSDRETFIKNIVKEVDLTKTYDELKNESLYTNLHKGKFCKPSERITRTVLS